MTGKAGACFLTCHDKPPRATRIRARFKVWSNKAFISESVEQKAAAKQGGGFGAQSMEFLKVIGDPAELHRWTQRRKSELSPGRLVKF